MYQIKHNDEKKGIYTRYLAFHSKVKTFLTKPLGIFLVLFFVFGFFVLMFFMNILYSPNQFFNQETNQYEWVYWRSFQSIIQDRSEILRIFYPVVAKILLSISIPSVGYAVQITTRNRLSSPSTLGFTPAAILSYITFLIAFPNRWWMTYIIGFVFTGVIIVINYLLQRQNQHDTKNFKPVLIGFAISASISAIGIVLSVTDPKNVNAAVIWTGELVYNNQWVKIYASGSIVLVAMITLLCLIPSLKIMQKDFLLAKSLGIRTNVIYWTVAIIAGILVVSTIVITTPLILIGLVMPNVVRNLFRRHTPLFVFLVGSLFTLSLLQFALFLQIHFQFGQNFLMAILSAFVLLFVMNKNRNV
ncbi:iron chelate uptake ABC transporter family permease subunit [Ureaplasma canigenitalium]|uniref:iron chelate uptake ABC transporter family permease subunit n=1 Tax=Ureaplasma canigenitalium TaxID=42092 RepID=UPI00068EC82E|nr:iron chelate uptake ABC transporter family permease subunit [Ureaplasma canigenitalium]